MESLEIQNNVGSEIRPLAGANAVTVLAPGTVANMVCGFDILGFALNDPSDVMELGIDGLGVSKQTVMAYAEN